MTRNVLVLVTHNIFQAKRHYRTGLMLGGRLIELTTRPNFSRHPIPEQQPSPRR
jgi:ABC-type phosphate transport system ATPase subunit